MTLDRYSSIDEAERRTEILPAAGVALDRMLDLVSLTPRECPPLFAPGIYRFRSLLEANEAREAATIGRMRALRAGRRR